MPFVVDKPVVDCPVPVYVPQPKFVPLDVKNIGDTIINTTEAEVAGLALQQDDDVDIEQGVIVVNCCAEPTSRRAKDPHGPARDRAPYPSGAAPNVHRRPYPPSQAAPRGLARRTARGSWRAGAAAAHRRGRALLGMPGPPCRGVPLSRPHTSAPKIRPRHAPARPRHLYE